MSDIGELRGAVVIEDKGTAALDDLFKGMDRLKEGTDKLSNSVDAWAAKQETAMASTSKAVGIIGGGVAAGLAAFGAITGAINLVSSSAERALGWLGDITMKGAEVGDVADNFATLSGSAAKAESTLAALRQGTHNTIDDLRLMKMANADLSAGLKLTEEQYGTMAKGAFALAQATGRDVASSLETVNRAMLTGQTRALAAITGKIDLRKAETEYAKSLGTTADQLSTEGKMQAARIGILDAVAKATDRLGEQTDGLDEILAQASTWWANFEDELGRTIANSPVLIEGLQSIKNELILAFGDDKEALIRNAGKAVEWIAFRVLDLAEAAVSGGAKVVSWMASLGIVVGDTMQIFGLLEYSALGAAKALAWLLSIGGNFGPFKQDVASAAAEMKTLWTELEERGKKLKGFEQLRDSAEQNVQPVMDAINRVRDNMGKAGQTITTEFVGPVKEAGVATTNTGISIEKTAKTIETATAASIKRAGDMWDQYEKAVNDRRDRYATPEEQKVNAAEGKIKDLDVWLAAELRKLDTSKKNNKNYWNERAAIDAVYWERREQLELSKQKVMLDKEMSQLKEYTDAMAQAIEDSINYAPIASVLSDVPGAKSAWIPDRRQIGDMEQTMLRFYSRAASGAKELTDEQKNFAREMERAGFSARQIADHMDVSFNKVEKALVSTRQELSNVISATAQFFTQIAQIASGSDTKLSRVVADIANIVVTWDQARKAADGYKNAQSAAGKAAALMQGAMAVHQATGQGSTASRAIGGAASGAEMGMAVGGPWGAVIGGGIGLVMGLVRGLQAQEIQVNKTRDAFQRQFGEGEAGFRKMNQAVFEATGSLKLVQDLLNAKTVDDYTRAQNALVEALNKQQEALSTINEMGFQSQEQLDNDVKRFQNAYDAMLRAGTYTTEQLEAMWDRVEEAQRAARDPGQEMEDAAKRAGYESREDLKKAAEDARKLAEYMRDSGKYTAAQVEDAFDKASEAQKRAMGINTKALDELQGKYDELVKGIAQEAPEAEMGVIERAMRDQADALKRQIEEQKAATDAAAEQSKDTWSDTAERYKDDWQRAGGSATDDMQAQWDETTKYMADQNEIAANTFNEDWKTATNDTSAYIQDVFSGMKIRIPIGFDVDAVNLPGGNGSGNNEERGGISMREGGYGYASGPVTFHTNGDEQFAFSGEGKTFADAAPAAAPSNSGPVTIQIKVDGRIVKEAVFDSLEKAPTSRDIHIINGLARAGKKKK